MKSSVAIIGWSCFIGLLLSGCGGAGSAGDTATTSTTTTSVTSQEEPVDATSSQVVETSTDYVNGHPISSDTNEYGIDPSLGVPPELPVGE